MSYIENAVTLEQVARVTKRTAADLEAEAGETGLVVGCDWAGRPAVSDRDARQLVSGEARRTQEHEREWGDYQRACKEWERARAGAVEDARRTAVEAWRRRHGGLLSGDAATAGREAAIAAGEAFERSTPAPTFAGRDLKVARRRFVDEGAPGLLSRVGSALKAGAR